MTFDYIPKGVCARKFTIQVEDGVIQSVKAEGAATEIFREFPTL